MKKKRITKPYNVDENDSRYYDSVNNGLPKTLKEKILSKHYLYSVIAQFFIGLAIAKKINYKFNCKKTFITAFLISIPMSFMWGAYMAYSDPTYKGWFSMSFNSIGSIGYWSIEDCLFYPGAFVMFYFLYRWVQSWKLIDFKHSVFFKWVFFLSFLNLICFMLFFSHSCGVSLTLMFSVPGLAIMVCRWSKINFKTFIIYFIIMVVLEVVWDVSAVSFLRFWKGWAAGWRYLSFDANGVVHHSNVFMSYPKWWLFESPMEITPYYAISGAPYAYLLIDILDQIFYGKKQI